MITSNQRRYMTYLNVFRLLWLGTFFLITVSLIDQIAIFLPMLKKGFINSASPYVLMVFQALSLIMLVIFFSIGRKILASFLSSQDSLELRINQLQALLTAIPDMIVFKDYKGRWQMANQAALSTLNLKPNQYKGLSDQELNIAIAQKRFLEQCEKNYAKVWDSGEALHFEGTLEKQNKQIFDIIETPIYAKRQSNSGTLMVARDITKIKDIETELKDKNAAVTALKNQQDGDYFLTTLLLDQLQQQNNTSTVVKTDILHKPLKKFSFNKRDFSIGGDLTLVFNIKMTYSGKERDFLFSINSDAMGKSIQGAGGALVFGAAIQAEVNRAQENIPDDPRQWLTDLYTSLNNLFVTFNGTMAISALVSLICEDSGEMWFFNAEHTMPILYRDGSAQFLQKDINAHKMGFDLGLGFSISKFLLNTHDVIIIGSDGKDDIIMVKNSKERYLNDDPEAFLGLVQESKAEWPSLIDSLENSGQAKDDISLLRIEYQGTPRRIAKSKGSTSVSSAV